MSDPIPRYTRRRSGDRQITLAGLLWWLLLLWVAAVVTLTIVL